MSQDIRNLEPKAVWNNFADLNAVPRPSKKEERVIQFIKDFGKSLGLETIEDHVGNVIIKKPASPGMEKKTPIVMQSHLDMVHQKNADTKFDFEKEGIKMKVDGDWVKAKGTTLGADNGLGVASIMSILASKNIDHPAMEALFTIDEETGMTGALGLQGGMLKGKILLNLDTEDDKELSIGCAGGIDVTATGSYEQEDIPKGMKAYKLTVNGLTGGHSGMDIHLGRGNANKLMNRILYKTDENFGLRISEIDGGGLRNAIPRESFATVLVPDVESVELETYILKMSKTIAVEFKITDPDSNVSLQSIDSPAKVLSKEFQKQVVSCIYANPNGIYRMSPDIPDLVQTSNNLARVLIKDGQYSIQCLTRSSVDTEKIDLANTIQAIYGLLGAKVAFSGSYPGWTPKPDSDIVKIMADLYREMYNEEPLVMACHAGLECGIIGQNYPGMEMISFGPNIRGAHSPDEKAQISSVKKYWGYLVETLKRIPEAG